MDNKTLRELFVAAVKGEPAIDAVCTTGERCDALFRIFAAAVTMFAPRVRVADPAAGARHPFYSDEFRSYRDRRWPHLSRLNDMHVDNQVAWDFWCQGPKVAEPAPKITLQSEMSADDLIDVWDFMAGRYQGEAFGILCKETAAKLRGINCKVSV